MRPSSGSPGPGGGGGAGDQVFRVDAVIKTVAGGYSGDNGVAASAARNGLPLAAFPGGTLNHFARDTGLTAVEDTAAAVEAGTAELVDIAEVVDRRRAHVAIDQDDLPLGTRQHGRDCQSGGRLAFGRTRRGDRQRAWNAMFRTEA